MANSLFSLLPLDYFTSGNSYTGSLHNLNPNMAAAQNKQKAPRHSRGAFFALALRVKGAGPLNTLVVLAGTRAGNIANFHGNT